MKSFEGGRGCIIEGSEQMSAVMVDQSVDRGGGGEILRFARGSVNAMSAGGGFNELVLSEGNVELRR
jgi:hypothetical protein